MFSSGPQNAPSGFDASLPCPPTDVEKYSFFGRRHRWYAFYSFTSFSLAIASMIRLSLASGSSRLLWPLAAVMFTSAALSLSSGSRGRRTEPSAHRAIVEQWRSSGPIPAVDVFLPSCGEPLQVLANTYRAVAELDWAGELNVYVLDDSARPEVEAMAGEFAFHYLSRPNRGHLKKAGNLIYGYGHSAGDLILVLDADFAPRPDMLNEMVPYFDDPSIAILQTPQFFDAHREMPWIQRTSGVEQRLFYRLIQPSRDKVDGAICVGTCAVYRREALERSEGFAQIGHSEDVHTGVNMIRAGYKVRYLPVVLAKGLCPDTFGGYVNMMYRWCTGSLSLMADKRFHATPMRLAQRACYWTGFVYYLVTATTVVFGALPALVVVWFFPDRVHPTNALLLAPSLLGSMFVLPAILGSGRVLDLLRLRTVYAYTFLHAVADFARKASAAWVPSGVAKSTKLDRKVRRTIAGWGGLVQLITSIGIARGIAAHGMAQYSVMVATSALSIWVYLSLALPGHGMSAPADTPRTAVVPRPRAGHARQEAPLEAAA